MFPFLTIFIIFLLVLAYVLRKSTRREEEVNARFWERESAANTTRKQDLSTLNYISIPQDLCDSIHASDEGITNDCKILSDLSNKKIVNLSQFSNTDLKLKYGIANLGVLSEYDENYTTLICTLVQLSKKLIDCGQSEAAIRLLRFGIDCQSDISENYTLLAALYKESSQDGPLAELYSRIQLLPADKQTLIRSRLQ